ncbi:WD40-repeat-containing domain protein [Blastocladiella britannica]|nr:WD40-repeat-containing domain protein [Blastocladiella britannica]
MLQSSLAIMRPWQSGFQDSRATNEHSVISLTSTWRLAPPAETVTAQAQTDAISVSSTGMQAPSQTRTQSECQTEPVSAMMALNRETDAGTQMCSQQSLSRSRSTARIDMPRLARFLQSIERDVSAILMENTRTSAFDEWPIDSMSGFGMDGSGSTEDISQSVAASLVAATDQLMNDPLHAFNSAERMEVTAADRSSTGRSIVLAYGYTHPRTGGDQAQSDHQADGEISSWCTHAASVSMLANGARTAHTSLPACATSVAIHPVSAAWVAVALVTGDIGVWDTLASDPARSLLLSSSQVVVSDSAASARSVPGHADMATAVAWSPYTISAGSLLGGATSAGAAVDDMTAQSLWSAGLDGSLIEWQLKRASKTPTRIEAVRRVILALGPRTALGMPLSRLAVHPDPAIGMLIVGSDAGQVAHVDIRRVRQVASPLNGSAASHDNNGHDAPPVAITPTFCYSSHTGPVTALAFNPHEEASSIFFTAGTDGRVAIRRTYRSAPIATIVLDPGAHQAGSAAVAAVWSPHRPAVLAAATASRLFIFDLGKSRGGQAARSLAVSPVVSIDIEDAAAFHTLAFHPQLPLLYAGTPRGLVTIRLTGGVVVGGSGGADMSVRQRDLQAMRQLSETTKPGSHDGEESD